MSSQIVPDEVLDLIEELLLSVPSPMSPAEEQVTWLERKAAVCQRIAVEAAGLAAVTKAHITELTSHARGGV